MMPEMKAILPINPISKTFKSSRFFAECIAEYSCDRAACIDLERCHRCLA